MYKDLKKKNIYIIGGLGLVGNSFTSKFGKICKNVIIIDRKVKKNIKNLVYLNIDINSSGFYKKITSAFQRYGNPDIMINCSYPKTNKFKNLSFKNYSQIEVNKNIDLHLKSYLNCSYVFAEHMKKNKIKGSIVNLSSIYGIVAQKGSIYKNQSINPVYPIIKSGINNLTKQFASNYGNYGIRFNSICPGGIENKKSRFSVMFKKKYLENSILKRMCSPEDVANAISFLISDNSSYITGVILPVDGGWTAI